MEAGHGHVEVVVDTDDVRVGELRKEKGVAELACGPKENTGVSARFCERRKGMGDGVRDLGRQP